jgi:PERQ amino acid-rich with GYF domain-containing protein
MRKRDGTGSASILLYPIRKNTNIILADQPALTIPRKLSLSSTQGPLGSPRDSGLPSPRTRGPHTPGFDGILNSGDTRVSRRRASESGTRLNSGATPRADGDVEPQASSSLKIDEEEEEHHRRSESADPLGQGASPQDSSTPLGDSPQEPELSNVDNTDSSTANDNEDSTSSALHTATHPVAADGIPVQVQPLTNSVPVTSSQPVTNPAGIEWTYLDPQGQVQGTTSMVPDHLATNQILFLGPFHAELMQKWYEEGYFTIDLLMRRVHLDESWTPVGELAQRAGSERVFFFNFDAPAVPPGLSCRREPSRDPVQQHRETNGYNAPYQPVPTRSAYPTALDSYFASSPASNSPSSSFGAGRFGNTSPDPSAFGGLVGAPISSTDPPIGSRSGNVVDPAFVGVRRTGFADTHFEQGFNVRAGLSNNVSGRTSSVDSYSLNPSIPSQSPWASSNPVHPASLSVRTNSYDQKGPSPFTSHLSTGLDPAYSGESSLTRGLVTQQDPLGQTYGNVNQRDLSRLGSRDLYQLEHRAGLGLGGFDGSPSVSPFDSPVQHQPFPQSPSMNFASPASQQVSSTSAMAPTTISPSIPPTLSQSTWNDSTESAPKHTGLTPFDNAAFPTSRNTTSTRTMPPSVQPWAPIKQPTATESSQSPWFNASQVDDGWGNIPGPHSLTVSNLTQHTQQQESREVLSRDSTGALDSPVESIPLPEALPPPVQSLSISAPQEPPQQQPTRSGRKLSVPTNSAQPITPTSLTPGFSQPAKEPTPPPSIVSPPTKPVWSTDDDKKRSAGGLTSLREIQEMESKKQEARKAAERERVRTPAAASASASEDAQTFTASWGLPTSQVGAKTSVKDASGPNMSSASTSASSVTISSPTPPSSAPPVAVWTNTQKSSTKKSMRDILEEEERRKKAASKESTVTPGSRRAYAETTTKVRIYMLDSYFFSLIKCVSCVGEPGSFIVWWGMDHCRCQWKDNGSCSYCISCWTSDCNPIVVHRVSSLVQRNRHCCGRTLSGTTSKGADCCPQG